MKVMGVSRGSGPSSALCWRMNILVAVSLRPLPFEDAASYSLRTSESEYTLHPLLYSKVYNVLILLLFYLQLNYCLKMYNVR